jgi:hypothetical protein
MKITRQQLSPSVLVEIDGKETPAGAQAKVDAAVNALINGSPGALDTLIELAAAMGNDPNFATTIINTLALKASLSSPAFTDTPTAPTAVVGTNTTQLANTAFVYSESTRNIETHRSGKDTNGKFVTIDYKRQDATLFMKSVLSGTIDALGNYPTRTETYYALNGITVLKTITYTRTFDSDGDIISEVY